MNSHVWWYLARATGIVAWAAAVGSVAVGLVLASRIGGRSVPPSWLLAMHRHLGALTLAFTGAHLASLVADSYAHFGVADLFVPFASDWQPRAVAWGVLAFWALLAVEVTSLLRSRISRSLWRSIHFASYAAAVAATAHLVTAGTDAANPALRWAPTVLVAGAAALVTYRLLQPRRAPAR